MTKEELEKEADKFVSEKADKGNFDLEQFGKSYFSESSMKQALIKFTEQRKVHTEIEINGVRFSNISEMLQYMDKQRERIAELEDENKVLAQNLEDTEILNKTLVNKIAELERKYQELVDKLHHCWNCKKSFDKSCSFGKMLEAEKKKCKDWESTFGISD